MRGATDLFQNARVARRQTGKSYLRQARELAALRLRPEQNGASDYYRYRLYDEDHITAGTPDDFLGWRHEIDFSRALNARHAVLPAWDKLTFTCMARAFGLPVAPIVAVYHRSRQLDSTLGIHLKTEQELAAYLRSRASYPLFGKPSHSQRGFGIRYLAGYCPETDSLQFHDGSRIPVSKFAGAIARPGNDRFLNRDMGFLLQAPVPQHEQLSRITGNPLPSGLRMVVLNNRGEARIHRAMWKCTVPPNVIDNFDGGATGNLVGEVSTVSGRITRLINGLWPGADYLATHPVTGMSTAELVIPAWQAVCSLCKDTALAFPMMAVLHLDIIVTPSGPVLLEVNDLGGLKGIQALGAGILANGGREFLRLHGNAKVVPWIRRL